MLYLLDANVLISAQELHYNLSRIPQFWDWVLAQADAGLLKMPVEIFNEIAISNGPLKDWLTTPENAKKLKLAGQVDGGILQKVITEGYAPDLTDSDLEQIGQDPFLVAYAIPYGADVTVVTREVSSPKKQRQNRKVPDVCKQFGVLCITDFKLFEELDFRITP